MSTDKKQVYGIDLGTTYSAIAYVDESGKSVAIRNSEGDTTTPSVVYFAPDGNITVGKEAKKTSSLSNDDAVRTVAFVKREMSNKDWSKEFNGETYDPAKISSLILKRIAEDAKKHGGHEVKDVVITCPAYFGQYERNRTRQAGTMAGLNVLEILDEPVAAAINYGLNANNKGQNIIVYDLGGGTFDVTVVSIGNDPDKTEVSVVCTEGDHQLGGFNWDNKIVEYGKMLFKEENGDDLENSEDAYEVIGQLKLDAEENKKSLSQQNKVSFRIRADGGTARFDLTREKFDELTSDLLEQTFTLIDKLLEDAKKTERGGITKFDAFLLVGGSTLMPQVAEKVKERYAAKLGFAEPVFFDVHEAVAKGAAKVAEIKYIQGLIANIQGLDGGQDSSTAPPPSEEVLKEVALLTGKPVDQVKEASKTRTRKVATKSYGIRANISPTEEAVCNLIIKQTPAPIVVPDDNFQTADEWSAMYLRIYSNDVSESRASVSDSVLLVEKEFPLPETLPKGTPLELIFKLNEEGKLTVFCKEGLHGRTCEFDITPPGALTEEEVQEEANKNALRCIS